MELVDTHMTFTWEELRDAIREGSIERMISNIWIMLDYGYTVSVHTRYSGDMDFSNIHDLETYIDSIAKDIGH